MPLHMPQLPLGSRCMQSWGQVGAWVEAYAEHSRRWSPRGLQCAHHAIGLWVLSTVAARRVYCQVGASQVYPVLFLAMVARSTLYAKTTTAAIGRDVIRRAGCQYLMTADRMTPQALMRSMAGYVSQRYGAMNEDEQAYERQRLAFAGQRGSYMEEWGGMLAQMRRSDSPMHEFHALLRVLDDNQSSYANETVQRGLERIESPYLALLASATPHDLQAYMEPGSAWWHDGFWPRFAFLIPRDDEHPSLSQRARTGYHVPGGLLAPLHTWHTGLGIPSCTIDPALDVKGKQTGQWQATIGTLPQQELGITEAVYEAYEAYNAGLLTLIQQGDVPEDLDASYGRLHEKCLRISLLLASLEHSHSITMAHWAYAQHIVESWRKNLHLLVTTVAEAAEVTKEQRDEQRILTFIAERAGGSIRDIQMSLRLGSSGYITQLVDHLVKAQSLYKMQAGRRVFYTLFPNEEDKESPQNAPSANAYNDYDTF